MTNNFNSLDKLMELGLSMAVAQQMMNTMTHAMRAMPVAGSDRPMQQPDKSYFIVENDLQAGPFSEYEMEELIKQDRLHRKSLVWKSGLPSWKYAEEISEINKAFMLSNK